MIDGVKIKVVVVSPKYQLNVGYIARVSANFGVEKLEIVNPRCNVHGKTAIKYSKAARWLIDSAILRKKFEESIRGTFSVATTGIWRKGGSASYSIYTPSRAAGMIGKSGAKRIAIVLGRDDTGLRKDEIEKCDIAVFVQASPLYPVLNISHALAVILYELRRHSLSKPYSRQFESFYASQSDKDRLTKLFALFVKHNKNVKDKREVAAAFKRIVDKSHPTKKELNAVAAAISLKKN
ncbi:MAG: TrmH family RNA methyltransferase [Candidatus Micrarchaeaceae archaeon]